MEKHPHLEDHLLRRGWFWKKDVYDISHYIGCKDEALVELSRLIKHPV